MHFTALCKIPLTAGKLLSRQTVLCMKLTAVLILAAFLHVNARTVYAQNVTLKERNVSLVNVLNEIQKQTGYHFLYTYELLEKAGKVDIDVKNASLQDALEKCLADKPLTYSIVEKTVVIKPKIPADIQPAISSSPSLPLPNIDVSITVVTTDNLPLEGASVIIKGMNKGVATDLQGHTTLKNVDPNATLVISFTGYVSQELKINNRVVIMVRLSVSISQLDEVQLTAYNKTTKRFSTSNSNTVKGEDIEKQPVSNPLLALEGRVPGLFITQTNGMPGSGVTVRIQGQNSIVYGNDPLYVIDGVPYASQIPGSGVPNPLGGSGGSVNLPPTLGSPLSYINPSDIERIDVLKDADATAIYGSRAANGAILITTKKGKAGETRVDVNIQNGWGHITRTLPVLNTQQYLAMRREALKNDNLIASANPAAAAPFVYAPDLTIWDTTRNTDWQKVLIGGTSQYTNLNASVSGGTNNFQYLISGTYHKETTVFPGDFNNQSGTLYFNINSVSANQKFHIQLSASYSINNNHLPKADPASNGTAGSDPLLLEPDAPALFKPDGTLNWAPNSTGTSTWTNPLAINYNDFNDITNNLTSSVVLSYKILPGLEIKSNFGYNHMQQYDFDASPLIAVAPEKQPTTNRTGYYGYSNASSWSIEPQLTYTKNIRKSKLDVLIAASIQQNNNDAQYFQGSGYPSDQVISTITSATTVFTVGTSANVYKYAAAFGQINYRIDDKYIVNLTGRRDGTSRFGPNSQFHDFGSAGAAWILSKEDFFKKALPIISFVKLRANYGTTGSDQIGDYSYLSRIFTFNPAIPYQGSSSLAFPALFNPYLQWEETQKLSLGLDLGFFKDRILISASYARNRSSNELLSYNLPLITGFPTVSSNFPATVQNTSIELSINTINIKTKDFNWSSSLNLTIPQNKLIAFPNLATSSYSSTLIIGQPTSIKKLFHFGGVDPQTGQYFVIDRFGNPTSSPNFSLDNYVVITTLPKYYGGFQNSLSYKGFQLDFLFQFTNQMGGNIKYSGNRVPGSFFSGASNEPLTVLDNHWQKPGDIASIGKYSSTSATKSSNALLSDAGYTDASYIRLKNLSLAYQFSGKWLQKSHIKNLRLYIQGQNLLTITHFQGLDPENPGNSGGTSNLPPLRVLTAGIQVSL